MEIDLKRIKKIDDYSVIETKDIVRSIEDVKDDIDMLLVEKEHLKDRLSEINSELSALRELKKQLKDRKEDEKEI